MPHDSKPCRRETWRLDKLVSFPTQAEFFERLSDHDLAQLAEDIKRNGLKCPIEILGMDVDAYVAGTIISGHQRKLAQETLGLTKTEVIVRDDLADAGAATIERAFLEANLNRRQLHPLDKARSVLRLFEIEGKHRNAKRGGNADEPRGKEEARDRVGKAIGVSGRTLSRYLCVLRTSPAVQAAFRAGNLSLVLAEKVSKLGAKEQRAIDERLAQGEAATSVVRSFAKPRRASAPSVGKTVAKLMKALAVAVEELPDDVDEIPVEHLAAHETTVKSARRILRRIAKRFDQA